jgi:hypothetical protein
MPESTDQDVEGGRLVPELDRDLRWRPPLDEEGVEGFIAAMEGGSGLEEEAPAGLVVHGVGSHRLTVFRRRRSPERTGCAGRDKPAGSPTDPGFLASRATPRAEEVVARPTLGMRKPGREGRKTIKDLGSGRWVFPWNPSVETAKPLTIFWAAEIRVVSYFLHISVRISRNYFPAGRRHLYSAWA